MYGVVGYKTHAKLALDRAPRNRTASAATVIWAPATTTRAPRGSYTDYGLFTCDDEIGQDVHELFLQLTSLTQTPKPATESLQSPVQACTRCLLIANSRARAEHARAGLPVRGSLPR